MSKFQEVQQLVEYMKAQGVSSFMVGDVTVEFGMAVPGPTERALPQELTPEAREEELSRIKERMKQLSESADQDMFWST